MGTFPNSYKYNLYLRFVYKKIFLVNINGLRSHTVVCLFIQVDII